VSLDLDLRVADRLVAELHADAGDVVAVVGPNGAGKTTLLHALAGLVPAEGQARLDGRDLLAIPVREREVGLVFQGQLLFPHLSAVDNVAFGLRARGVARSEADEVARGWLERFGIGSLAARRPGQLSGGQAQRVAIARALATDPGLLLLDEPFAGLDVAVATALRIELAAHLAAYDGIALLVTHEALDALTLADRVLVLDQGRVAQEGAPEEVAARPRTEHVAGLVGLNVLREEHGYSSFRPSDVTVSRQRPVDSARYRWTGIVAGASPHGDAVRLVVDADDGPRLLVDVTPRAAAELALAPGADVWLSVKQTAMTSYAVDPEAPDSIRP